MAGWSEHLTRVFKSQAVHTYHKPFKTFISDTTDHLAVCTISPHMSTFYDVTKVPYAGHTMTAEQAPFADEKLNKSLSVVIFLRIYISNCVGWHLTYFGMATLVTS